MLARELGNLTREIHHLARERLVQQKPLQTTTVEGTGLGFIEFNTFPSNKFQAINHFRAPKLLV